MDYGKLAYIKAEELESRLSGSYTAKRTMCSDYTTRPVFDMKNGDYSVTDIRAGGYATIFVRASVRADSEISSVFSVKINGLPAGGCDLSAEKDETRDLFVMCAAAVDGTAAISVTADGADCTLMSCQVLVSGQDAFVARPGGDASADKCGEVWALISSEDDNIYARTFTEQNFSLSDRIYIGTGRRADICAAEDGFTAVYVDVTGNCFAVFTDKALNRLGGVFVAPDTECAAVARCKDGFVVARVSAGEIFYNYISSSGGLSASVKIPLAERATGVGFVKNSSMPMLIVRTAERSLMKKAEFGTGGGDSVMLFADITLTAVGG